MSIVNVMGVNIVKSTHNLSIASRLKITTNPIIKLLY
jgi:hypothetical protein